MSEENNIPKHWQIKKLVEVCDEIFAGGDVPKNNFSSTYCEEYQIPIYANGEKNKGLYGYTNISRVSSPCVTISARGTIGYTEVRNKPFFPIVRLIVLKPNENLDIFFLKYVIDSCNIKHTGSSIPQLTVPTVKTFSIPLPPLPEQQAIVSKIEELLSDLENGKQQLQLAQQQLKIYRQSLLKWAFEGKLTNKGLKDGELPKGWKIVNITDLAEKNKHALKAGPFGSSLKKEFYTTDGYKIYGQEQVISDDAFIGDYYVSDEKYQELKSCKIKPFDVLISLVGTVGKVLILPQNCKPGIINPRLIKISLNTEIYLPKFFKYYFESSYVKNFYSSKAQGTTMDVLNLGIIKTIPFPLLPIHEQQLIVDELESKLTVCDKIEETISQSLLQAESLRQSILKKAFEGKLV